MMMRILLPAAALVLAAASPHPPTLSPPVTGTMYNGNNAQAPKLGADGKPQPMAGAPNEDEGTPRGGHGATQGGAG